MDRSEEICSGSDLVKENEENQPNFETTECHISSLSVPELELNSKLGDYVASRFPQEFSLPPVSSQNIEYTSPVAVPSTNVAPLQITNEENLITNTPSSSVELSLCQTKDLEFSQQCPPNVLSSDFEFDQDLERVFQTAPATNTFDAPKPVVVVESICSIENSELIEASTGVEYSTTNSIPNLDVQTYKPKPTDYQNLNATNIVERDSLVNFQVSFSSCPQSSLVSEDEVKLPDHEEVFHSDGHLQETEEQLQVQRRSQEELRKFISQRTIWVSLENISTRSQTCKRCGMSVPILEISSHRRNHCENYRESLASNARRAGTSKTCLKKEKTRVPTPSKSSVRLKMKVQAKTKPHQCRFCDKRFVSASQCKSHENAHTEVVKTVDGCDSAINSKKRPRGRPFPKTECLKPTPDRPDSDTCNSEQMDNSNLGANICNDNLVLQPKPTELRDDDVNDKALKLHLQGMPVLKSKIAPIDESDWSLDASNSSYGPPELIPQESEDKIMPVMFDSDNHIAKTPENLDTCQTCGEEVLRSNLLDHIRSHLEKGQRDCSLCEYQGHSFKDLREHINKHYGLRPYECRFCDKNFCWETGLKKHMLASHEDMTPFKCPQCSLRFSTHRERRRHELTHKNILKPGAKGVSGPSRRLSHSPSQSPEKMSTLPRRRSLSITPSFEPSESNTNIRNQSSDSFSTRSENGTEFELRKRSLYPIPEFAPGGESTILNSEFGPQKTLTTTAPMDFINEIQPRTEERLSEYSPSIQNYSSSPQLQTLAPLPECGPYSSMPPLTQVGVNVGTSSAQSEFSSRSTYPSFSDRVTMPLTFNNSVHPPPLIPSGDQQPLQNKAISEYSRSRLLESLTNKGVVPDPDRNREVMATGSPDASALKMDKRQESQIYQEKPDPREFEKCKTCSLKIPIDDLMSHIQSHLKPRQKKCDICSYEATSWKLLPEHMNVHYVLKPFQCNICKRRFAMKGYLRSHHQQVHESADNRRYVCHYCDKRFVRPCHRKAHEKGVHFREGAPPPVPNDEKNSDEDEPKVKKTNTSVCPSTPSPLLDSPRPAPAYSNSPSQSTSVNQSYNLQNTWSNPKQPSLGYNTPNSHNHSQIPMQDNSHTHNSQGQGHIDGKLNDYWQQQQHQQQSQIHSQSMPIPNANQELSQDMKPNMNWSEFQASNSTLHNEFDLKGADLNTHQYMNTLNTHTQHDFQNHGQMQDFSYNTNAFNYQGFNATGTGIAPADDYGYSSSGGGWAGGHPGNILAPADPIAMNYGSYNPALDVNGDCDNNILGSDARWSTADPYGILQTHEPPVLHENTYTISRPSNSVDLWAELRHEELKLFPEGGYSYSQHNGSMPGMHHPQRQPVGINDSSYSTGVPLIAPQRSLPLIPDLMESSDGYTNGFFDGIPHISPDNLYQPNVDGLTDTLFDEVPDLALDDSLSGPSGDNYNNLDGSSSRVACRTCGQMFLKGELIAHVRSHLTKGQKTCDICQHTFCSTMALRDHVSTHYQFKAHQCLTCFKYFSTKHSLKNHIVCIHEGKREAKCQICSKTFTLVFSLRRHMRLVHKINPKNGLKLAPLLVPSRSQSNKKGVTKKNSEVGKESKQTKQRPIKTEEDKRKRKGKVEETEQKELHEQILQKKWTVRLEDIGRSEQTCGFCQIPVLVKDLISHRRNHKETCHICGKDVKVDQMLHHGITHVIDLTCEICSWKARTRSQLWEHMNCHLGVKPVKCSMCGTAFASRTSLRTHYLARHTKFRPHQCNYCERSFVQLSVRQIHEMTHYGTKCPVCGEEFERKKDLVTHMKDKHTDEECLRKPSSLN